MTRVVTPRLEAALTAVVAHLDEEMGGDNVNPFPIAKLRDELLEAFEEATADQESAAP